VRLARISVRRRKTKTLIGQMSIHGTKMSTTPTQLPQSKSRALSSASIGAVALGATALGALAIGALAIGRLVIGRARIRSLTIGHLTVDRLTIRESVTPAQPR